MTKEQFNRQFGIILCFVLGSVGLGILLICLGENPPLTETGLRMHQFDILYPIGIILLGIGEFGGTAVMLGFMAKHSFSSESYKDMKDK
jgi:hypothetical protein